LQSSCAFCTYYAITHVANSGVFSVWSSDGFASVSHDAKKQELQRKKEWMPDLVWKPVPFAWLKKTISDFHASCVGCWPASPKSEPQPLRLGVSKAREE
jgi:hypothetical protein